MKRFVCFVLALVMVMSMMPMSGAVDDLSGESLSSYFILGGTKMGENDYMPYDPSFEIATPTDSVSFNLYLLLLGDSGEAGEAEYNLLDPSNIVYSGISSNISFGAVARDGYRYYCPVTITGTYSGPIFFDVKTTDGFNFSSNCMAQVYLSGQGPSGPGDPSDPSVDVALYTKRELSEDFLVSSALLNMVGLDNNRVWLMSNEGLTMEQIGAITVKGTSAVGDFEVIREDKLPQLTPYLRDGSNDRYDLAIDLVLPDAGGAVSGAYNLTFGGLYNRSYRVAVESECQQLNFKIGDTNYAAGFVFGRSDSDIFSIFENGNTVGVTSNSAAHEANQYIEHNIWEFDVGSITTDEAGINVYKKVDGASITINEVWIETHLGSSETFLLADGDGKPASTLRNVSGPLKTYMKDGYVAYSNLWANITITINSDDGPIRHTGDVAALITADQRAEFTFDYEADIATDEFKTAGIDTITEYLAYIAGEYIDELTYPVRKYNVTLGAKTYNETVFVDQRFSNNDELHLIGTAAHGAATTIVGGINLNISTAGSISNINFCADSANDSGIAKGIYRGRYDINKCSFYNYDIAVDSVGYVLPCITNSIFVNNDIAWNIEVDRQLWRPGNDYNSFINNGIAVKVKCDHSGNSAYYFRITESNFVNNDKDFVADTGSGVYMYRNYFGELKKNHGNEILPGKYAADKHNSLTELRLDEMAACKNAQISQYVQRRPAVIEVADSSTTVIANPRWKYPIKDWWKINNKLEYDKVSTFSMLAVLTDGTSEIDEYEDILVVDWTNSTTIISEEADTLIIDAEAFAEEGNKTIDVVDEEENALGTWTF